MRALVLVVFLLAGCVHSYESPTEQVDRINATATTIAESYILLAQIIGIINH